MRLLGGKSDLAGRGPRHLHDVRQSAGEGLPEIKGAAQRLGNSVQSRKFLVLLDYPLVQTTHNPEHDAGEKDHANGHDRDGHQVTVGKLQPPHENQHRRGLNDKHEGDREDDGGPLQPVKAHLGTLPRGSSPEARSRAPPRWAGTRYSERDTELLRPILVNAAGFIITTILRVPTGV